MSAGAKKPNKRKAHRSPMSFVVLAAVVAGIALGEPRAFEDLRNLIFDSYQRFDPPAYDPDAPVRVVAIDEASLASIGQWPWPRTRLVELTQKLKAAHAAAIAYDVIFAEPDSLDPQTVLQRLAPDADRAALARLFDGSASNDQQFATALRQSPSIIGLNFLSHSGGTIPGTPKAGIAIAGDEPSRFLPSYAGVAAPIPPLAAAAAGLGATNWLPDRDQIVRRVPLLLRQGSDIRPSLALESLRIAQGASSFLIRSSNAGGETGFGKNTGINAVRVGDLVIPTDAHGDVRPRFTRSEPRRFISAEAVLKGTVPVDEIEGRIIFIGPTAVGLGDIRATPLEPAVPGVEVHAQIVEQVFANHLLTRPDWSSGAELIAALGLIGGVAFALPLLPPLGFFSLCGLIVTALVGGSFALFKYEGLLIDPVLAGLSVIASALVGTLASWRAEQSAKRHVQSAFGKFLSPAVVARLADDPSRLVLGGETRELSVLFSDLRNFSGLSEGLSASELTQFMNDYLSPMTDAVLEAEGTVDKYIGDAIVAFWNAPLDDRDHAAHSVAAALRMREELRLFNQRRAEQALAAGRQHKPASMGIGLNLGPCSVGNMGSVRRFDYSILGDNVNLASRLEGVTKFYGLDILAAESIVEATPGLAWLEIDLVRVKGRETPTRIFTPLGDAAFAATAEFSDWHSRHMAMLTAYRMRDFASAAEAARALQGAVPLNWQDLYAILAARYAALVANPPGHEWNDIWTLDAK